MGETTTSPASVLWDAIRSIFSLLDWVVYGLLSFAYQIFFNVASANLFSNETVMKFYGRIQLIIGVFMMFQLAMTILKGIMDPDSFTNNKTGASNLIMRIATALILLTVLVPINIPSPKNEYEIQINNNGLLFGTLYSLQHRILSNNTLGRLILGTDNSTSVSSTSDDLKTSSRIFTSTILKGFYRINLLPEDERPKHEDGKDDSVFNDNRMCKDIDDDVLAAYTRLDADPNEIISMVNLTCEIEDDDKSLLQKALSIISPKLAGTNMYVFTFMPIISAIVGGIFAFILFSFAVDVAIRAIKLVILRLIAPIPIIMYMDPKGGKDSSFTNWVKTLTSTYLDLFIRLATVYFVIFLIQDMMINGIVIDVGGSGLVSIFSHIIIWIGLFAFAKQAPKFIKQVLGLKDDSGKLFSGFAEMGTALGMGTAVAGGLGTAIAGARASRMADETRKSYGENINPDSFLNRGKHLLAGIAGGVTGVGAGMSAAIGAKDHATRAVREAQQKQVSTNISNGGNGSTFFGRTGATFARTFLGDTPFDKDTRAIAKNKAIESSGKDLFSYLEGKGKTDGSGIGVQAKYRNADVNTSLDQFKRAWAEASSRQQRGLGDGSFVVDGQTFNINDGATAKFQDDLIAAAGTAWASANSNDAGFKQKLDTYTESGGTYSTMAQLKKDFKSAGGAALRGESDAKYKKRQADYGATKNK